MQLNANKGKRWISAAATVGGTVLVLQLVGLASRPLAWALGGAALVVVIALIATSRK